MDKVASFKHANSTYKGDVLSNGSARRGVETLTNKNSSDKSLDSYGEKSRKILQSRGSE